MPHALWFGVLGLNLDGEDNARLAGLAGPQHLALCHRDTLRVEPESLACKHVGLVACPVSRESVMT